MKINLIILLAFLSCTKQQESNNIFPQEEERIFEEEIVLFEEEYEIFDKKDSLVYLNLEKVDNTEVVQTILNLEKPKKNKKKSFVKAGKNANKYVVKILPTLIRVCKEENFPWKIAIAQAIHETGWGKSTLATAANNHFGYKANKDWVGPIYKVYDDNWVIPGAPKVYHQENPPSKKAVKVLCKFRKYTSFEASLKDYIKNMKGKRYQRCLTLPFNEAASCIQKSGYATSKKYATNLKKIGEKVNNQIVIN